MDTRTKIASSAAVIPAAGRRKLVTGYFDPLTAAHAARLAELRGDADQLVVAVKDPPDPLLPARARAELVAALAAVDYVLIPSDGGADGLPAEETIDEQAQDLARRAALSDHIMSRQNAKA